MLPLMRIASDCREHRIRDAIQQLRRIRADCGRKARTASERRDPRDGQSSRLGENVPEKSGNPRRSSQRIFPDNRTGKVRLEVEPGWNQNQFSQEIRRVPGIPATDTPVFGRGGSHGGIDGVIDEDKLGLDVLYIQAKRWEQPAGRPDIRKFAGALPGKKARKGVFITTSSFSKEARAHVANIDSITILIDGARLAELMVEHDIGVSTYATCQPKKVDSDFFLEA